MTNIPKGLSTKYWSTWSIREKSVSASLEEGESWIGGWDGIGLYEGNNKVPDYQSLTVHLTTHRLILVPEPSPTPSSSTRKTPGLQCSLRFIRQTEFYTGFMRSSAKITLTLGPTPTTGTAVSMGSEEGSWTCGVCGYVNAEAGPDGTRKSKCGLCGVGYELAKSISTPATRSSTPVPASRSSLSLERTPISTEAATPKAKEIACPACTFLNHPSLTACEICSTPLPRTQSVGPAAAVPNPAIIDEGKMDTARLSFRRGGEKEAYKKLKGVLSDKVWERSSASSRTERGATPANGVETPRPSAGIDGILQTMSLDAKNQDDHMKDAFKDLEVLMVRAGEMVKMAQSLNAKLSTSGAVTNEEATLIQSSLVQLGLPAPALTADMVRDEQKYSQGLAKELGQLLTGAESGGKGLMTGQEGRGVIGLDEVWGLWMRARGVALLPPSTLMAILPFLPDHTNPPINLLALPSSLRVLHTPSYAPPAILSRIISRLNTSLADPTLNDSEEEYTTGAASVERGFSLLEISSHENLPIGLTKELMESIEQITPPPGVREPVGLVRDDQAVGDGGVRWYRDLITGWEL